MGHNTTSNIYISLRRGAILTAGCFDLARSAGYEPRGCPDAQQCEVWTRGRERLDRRKAEEHAEWGNGKGRP